jgi:hypothetical protein
MSEELKKTTTISIAITPEFKEEIKAVARVKRWSVSQTLGILIEENWDDWVKQQGINTQSKAKTKK